MSYHINAKKSDIAKYVLMPGDPLRAKYIAYKYLKNVKMVNDVRNMFIFTGDYQNLKITIAASGMGCPTTAIYSYELFKYYDVELIIRIGTCGSYEKLIKVKDIINVSNAYGNKAFAKDIANLNTNKLASSLKLNNIINKIAINQKIKIFNKDILSSDVFYFYDPLIWKQQKKEFKICGVDMESFALFCNAIFLKKHAATLLTVSDSVYQKNESLTSKEKEQKLDTMINLALESIIYYANK